MTKIKVLANPGTGSPMGLQGAHRRLWDRWLIEQTAWGAAQMVKLQAEVYVGLGSNQGDCVHTLESARSALSRLPNTRIVAESRLYASSPVGGVVQPPFVNQVVALHTEATPFELLNHLQAIEEDHGRIRTIRWGPRTLDLDILDFRGLVMADDRLELPHPRMHERGFVLAPMAALAPALKHPVLGVTMQELYLTWKASTDSDPSVFVYQLDRCPK